jgi:hypothetical protein
MSRYLYEDELGFKWRVYWFNKNWGSYIGDEAGQKFDFWKSKDMIRYFKNININFNF